MRVADQDVGGIRAQHLSGWISELVSVVTNGQSTHRQLDARLQLRVRWTSTFEHGPTGAMSRSARSTRAPPTSPECRMSETPPVPT